MVNRLLPVFQRSLVQIVGSETNEWNVKQKCALLDILHEIPADSDLLDPSAAPSVVASLFKEQSTALLTTFRSKEVAEADPAVTIKVILVLCSRLCTSYTMASLLQGDSGGLGVELG